MVTLGLFGLVINAGLLLLIAWTREHRRRHVHGRRLPAGLRPRRDRGGGDRRHRDQHRRLGRRAWWSTTERRRTGCRSSRRALRAAGAAGSGRRPTSRISRRSTRPCAAVVAAFPDPWLRQYSVKANDVPAVIAAVARARVRGQRRLARRVGARAARGRAERADHARGDRQDAGRPARRGPGRGRRRPAALGGPRVGRGGRGPRRGPRRRAGAPPIDVLYRVNPDVAPETLAGLAVGAGGTKFGMTETGDRRGHRGRRRAGRRALRPRGIHLHVGSQLGAVDAWREGVRKALALAALLARIDRDVRHRRPGRRLPGRSAWRAVAHARAVRARDPGAARRRSPPTAGRRAWPSSPDGALVARAGWLVARVLHVRDRAGRQVILDAGMTELIRPALYGARHPITH